MSPADLLLDQLPTAQAQRWHDEGVACRMAANAGADRLTRARRLLTFAALLGKSSARYQLGVMNLHGEGQPPDKLRAAMWFKLAIARDEPRAQGNLAMVAEDLTRAELRKAYRMADEFPPAEAAFYRYRRTQDVDAIVELSRRLIEGAGLDPDPELAVAWLLRISDHAHPGASWLLGRVLLSGRGVPPDTTEGVRRLQLAAAAGHAGALHELGDWLLRQAGAANQAKAIECFEAAVRQDYLPAFYPLGLLYKGGESPALEAGPGQPIARPRQRRDAPHLARALALLTRAADAGLAEAAYEVGQMHAQGLGTAQDFEQALHWYEKAAWQGHAKAQFNLGFLYSHGQGVEQDYQKAYEWYAISEASGYALAHQNRDYIAGKLKPDAIERAQWRADSFRHRMDNET